MVALFAVGVITGTILSFEMGLLWPNFTGTFGSVFGLGFAIEGFSFFMEAIFIGIYVYGWGRLSPRAHLASGIPIVITGFTGSWMVIAVNAWMNHPGGLPPGRRARGRRPPVQGAVRQQLPVARADPHVHRRLHRHRLHHGRACYAVGRLRGRWGRYERTALAIPLTIAALASPVQVLVGDWAARDVAETQPTKLAAIEGLYQTTSGARRAHPRLVHRRPGQVRDRDPASAVAPRRTTAGTRRFRGSTRSRPASDRRSTSCAFAFQTMVGIGTLLALLGVALPGRAGSGEERLPESRLVLRAPWCSPAPLSLVALISGWVVTEVGRQPWVVYRVMPTAAAVTGAHGIPVGYGVLAASLRGGRVRAGLGAAAAGQRPARLPGEPEPDLGPTPRPPDRCSCKRSRWCSCWPGWPSTRCSPAPTSAPGSGSCRPAAASAPSASASTPTTSMAPVWEANHVWLIFVLTVLWTAYPAGVRVDRLDARRAAVHRRRSGSSSAAPPTRCAPARRAGASRSAIDTIFSLSSILTPFALGAAVGGIASGRVPVGNAAGDLWSSWLNPTSIFIGVLAVATAPTSPPSSSPPTPRGAASASSSGRSAAARWAPAWSPARVALGGLFVVNGDAQPAVSTASLAGDALAAVIVSALAGSRRRSRSSTAAGSSPRATRAALAVAAVVAGWALAQRPTILPGLTIDQAAAPATTRWSRWSIAVLAGGAILFPSLALLFRLAAHGPLRGRGGARRRGQPPAALPRLRTGLLARVAAAPADRGLRLPQRRRRRLGARDRRRLPVRRSWSPRSPRSSRAP